MTFEQAFNTLVDPSHEGGYVNDPRDPGGETKYGISKRSYPGEDIPNLTLARAAAIYRLDFWDPLRAEDLPDAVRFPMFDFAVNSGVSTAVKALQLACGATPDGKLGPVTLGKVAAVDGRALAVRIHALRLRYMTELKNWPDAGRGWARRIATNLLEVA